MAVDVAALTIAIDTLQAVKAGQDLDKFSDSANKAGSITEFLNTKLKQLVSVVGAVELLKGFADALKGAIELEASYVRLSQIAGTTASNISGLVLPAALAGTTLEAMAVAMSKLNREVGMAKLGDFGNKSQLLRALGIDPTANQDPAEVFVQVSRALVGMQDQTIAAKVAFDLLGRSYAEMKPAMVELINQGGIHKRVTDEQAEAAKKLDDTWKEIKHTWEDNTTALVNELMPAMQAALTYILQFSKTWGESGMARGLGGAFSTGTGNPGGGNNFDAPRGFQADIRALDNAQMGAMGGGARTGTPSAEETRVKILLDNQKFFEQRMAMLKASDAAYAEAVRTDLELLEQTYKATGANTLRAQEELIRQKQVLNDADLAMQAKSLAKARDLELGKDPQDLAGKAKAAQEAIALINQKRVDNTIITEAQIRALQATTFNQQIQQAQQIMEAIERSGEQVAEGLMTLREVEQNSYAKRFSDLEAFLAKRTVSEERAAKMREDLEKDHQFKMLSLNHSGIIASTDIQKMGWDQQLDYYTGTLANITSAAAQHNRTMFEINKVASIANAVVSMYEGANAALKWGWPLGPIFAGIIVAAGLVNIRAIASAQYGGGAPSPSVGAAAGGGATPVVNIPTTPAATTQGQGGGITVIIQGDFIGTQEFLDKTILPAIADATNNKDFLLFGPNSRQAGVQSGVGVS